ncbi:putative acyl-activating enzyme 19 [Nymphaea thermarum]|nr:putative acyl-activating enzyme 19 [Nymphaea thermarum]
MAVDVSAEARPHCCISHLFHAVASSCPSKIAVVHAVDGARVCRSLGERSAYEADFDEKKLLFACRISQSPPVYPGDEYFTYGKILSAVEELSVRIRVVLDGGDDPALIKPSGGIDSEAGKFCSFDDSPQLVGIFLAPSVYYLVAVLATLRIGEAFLPIDPSWPKHRVLSIVSSSRPALVITHPFSVDSNVEENEVPRWLVSGSNLLVLFQSDIHISKWDDNLSKSRDVYNFVGIFTGIFSYKVDSCSFVNSNDSSSLEQFTWEANAGGSKSFGVEWGSLSVVFMVYPSESIANYYNFKSLWKYGDNGGMRKDLMKEMLLYWLANCLLLVSGDCTFFDCKDLPKILETEVLSTVPIGKPIHGCKVILIGESNDSDDGEIFVGGACTSIGYLFNSASDFVYLRCHDESSHGILGQKDADEMYFRTGDFARRLRSGDYVFMGRNDRLVKIHGQRISLEEVEDTLRDHPDVSDSAVTVNSSDGEQSHLIAHIILKARGDVIPEASAASSDDGESNGFERTASSLKHWLAERLPSGMMPAHFQFLNSFPVTSSGKIDYASLAVPGLSKKRQRIHISTGLHKRHLETIKEVFPAPSVKKCDTTPFRPFCCFSPMSHGYGYKCGYWCRYRPFSKNLGAGAFCRALMAEKVMEDDDFFSLGGNSMAAAYLGHILGIDMRLIYRFPSPSKILKVMLDQTLLPEDSFKLEIQSENLSSTLNTKPPPVSHDVLPESSRVGSRRVHSLESDLGDTVPVNGKKQPARICNSLELDEIVDGKLLIEDSAWISSIHLATSVSFSRCNKITFVEESELGVFPQIFLPVEIDGTNIGKMQSLWKVNLKSCVDASPLVISMQGNVYLFIGAHSHFFVCVNALSGQLVWEVSLVGRVECSAAITDDFSQVIVGCYRGNVYFLDFMTGSIFWTFETGGEVCMLIPMVINYRFALVFVRNILYVGSTSGRVTAVSLQV